MSTTTRLWAIAFLSGVAVGQDVPSGFVVETLAPLGTSRPSDLCFLPDGRCLITILTGPVLVHASGSTAAIGTVPSVEFGGERGLLSIAADPAFAANGYIYVYYSHTGDDFMHLDRFTCTGDLANPASTNLSIDLPSRRVILGDLPDIASNHNGGSVRLGPDGMLYLSVGDDSYGCQAQGLTSQSGCLLRLSLAALPPGGSTTLPSYSSLDPGNNPLSANTDFTQLLIAYGLRNPFRMEVDPRTGNLYLGDVGYDDAEEYSEYVYERSVSEWSTGPPALRLVNFGWPWREGDLPGPMTCPGGMPTGLVEPIAVYYHGAVAGLSIIGGACYRNLGGPFDFGPRYEGNAFFVDHYTGDVRRLRKQGTWHTAPRAPGQSDPMHWATLLDWVTSLRLGPDGALWLTQNWPHELRRVRPIRPANTIAAISGGNQRGPAGESFPQPLVVRVLDPQGVPIAGAEVHFEILGPGVLSTTNPVLTDASGQATTSVAATTTGGPITVTATTSGDLVYTTLHLFARSITAVSASSHLAIAVHNQTDAVPAQVPYVLMLSFPGSPTLPTGIGPLCIDPSYPLAFVLEDGIGLFGYVSISGAGGVGSPGLTRIYLPPAGVFAGQLMRFQAIGLDPITGWFRTNCHQLQF
jgi:glucose/arabinose dehydrogenase